MAAAVKWDYCGRRRKWKDRQNAKSIFMKHPREWAQYELDLYGKLAYKFGMSLVRTSRLEARVAPETLTIVKRAAELQGQSVSEFVVAAAREAANRTIEETQIIRLSVADQRAFAEAVLNPPPPGEALQRAADAYRRHLRADD
jgi:uncharacterized protein (DUF1778 family)